MEIPSGSMTNRNGPAFRTVTSLAFSSDRAVVGVMRNLVTLAIPRQAEGFKTGPEKPISPSSTASM